MSAEWERIQQRTFTKWVNSHLRKRGSKVEDLVEECESGVPLIHLYEIISDEKLGKFYPEPKMKFHKIANLNKVVDKVNQFVGSVGIKLEFGAEQILEKDKRQVLGMIWVLIHKFEIQDISEEELSAREGLLLWCKKKTKGYPNVNVQNFKGSWQDGLAFCALIHKHRPDLLDFYALEPSNKKENLQLAFDVAEKELDIPQLLDADDMVNYTPDDKSVMTYVAYYWKKFASSNKADKAGRKLSKVAKRDKELENMTHDYEERARKLVDWVNENDSKLSDPSFDHFGNNLEKADSRKQEFKQFKDEEKPKQSAEKVDLELLLNNIRTKQKNEGLPVYKPPEELSSESIDGKWSDLGQKQDVYDKALREHITLMKRLEILLSRFRVRSKKIKEWQETKKENYFKEDISQLNNVSALQAKIKIHETFNEELEQVDKSLKETENIGNEVVEGKHEAAPEVNSTMETLNTQQQGIRDDGEKKGQELEDALKKLEELLRKCLDFAKKAENLNMFLDDISLSLEEPITASRVKDVDVFENIVQSVEQRHNEKKPIIDEIDQLAKDVKEAGGDPNMYSAINHGELAEKFNNAGQQIEDRKKQIEEEKNKLQTNEDLLKEFTESCDNYTTFTQSKKEEFLQIREGGEELEAQLNTAKEKGEAVKKESAEKYEELDKLFQKLEERQVLELSNVTQSEMQAMHDNLDKLVDQSISDIESAMLAGKNEGISEDQLKDFRETFKYFDKDKDDKLSKLEFKACCASLGEDVDDNDVEKIFKEIDLDNDGSIEFDEFIKYMSRLASEGSSYEDIIDSFKQLAGDKDYITSSELTSVMDQEEAEYLLSVMPKKEGVEDGYDYVAYAKNTFGKE